MPVRAGGLGGSAAERSINLSERRLEVSKAMNGPVGVLPLTR